MTAQQKQSASSNQDHIHWPYHYSRLALIVMQTLMELWQYGATYEEGVGKINKELHKHGFYWSPVTKEIEHI